MSKNTFVIKKNLIFTTRSRNITTAYTYNILASNLLNEKKTKTATMKAFLCTIISVLILSTSFAFAQKDGISISPNGKTAKIEIKFKSKASKTIVGTITIVNASGKVVSTQTTNLVNGENNIALADVATFEEGTYTVTMVAKKKKLSTKFIVWK
jgi:methionine-rich copper-binding protein CopC